MVPMAILFVGGYLAMTRIPATVVAPARETEAHEAQGWRERILLRPTYVLRSLAAIGAIGITVLGVAPMALAATNPVADPILNEAIDGTPVASNVPAAPFDLVDQDGRTVSLRSLRGEAVVLTFLDPVCTTDCPLIAQEFRQASQMLGVQSSRAVFVAIVANPLYHSLAVTRAFDEEQGLVQMKNWLYLTGSVDQLEKAWSDYGVEVAVEPAGSMVAHSEIAYVIDPAGHTRYVLNADPGQATTAMRSSFAALVAGEVRRVLTGS
jgi:cytochrome oxidase Cu insertion factor (SCO1/SenC/PrrC family)